MLTTVNAHLSAFQTAKKLYHERLAPEFSPFEFFRQDEMSLSRLIGWLLDPQGSHGQDGRFLRAFTALSGSPWSLVDCNAAKVYLEMPSDHGRLDIVVLAADAALVIENKPWAADQPKQIERYLSHLSDLGRSEQRLIYLTANGTGPSEGSVEPTALEEHIEVGDMILWGYTNELLEWLELCRRSCQAARVAGFIDEFIRLIRGKFLGMADMTELQHLVSQLTATPESVGAAMHVVAVADELKSHLTEILRSQLAEAAEDKGWRLIWNVAGKRYDFLGFDFTDRCPCEFRCSWDYPNYKGMTFGAYMKDPSAERISEVAVALTALSRSANTNEPPWAWWHWTSEHPELMHVPYDWGPDTWSQIPSGELAGQIVEAATAMRAALGRAKLL